MGTNVGDRWGHLAAAVARLRALPRTTLEALSQPFETEPVGGPAGQSPYLNAVARLGTLLDPFDLLRGLSRIERERGRVRTLRDAPRTLDLDLLFYGRRRIDVPGLTLPHPRALGRRFVLAPLAQVVPGGREPSRGRSIEALLREIPPRPWARPLPWPPALADAAPLR